MKRLLAFMLMLSMMAMPMASAYSSDSDWYWSSYYTEIEWMMSNGIMTGDDPMNFRPDDCVNRAEFTKVLYSMTGGVQDAEHEFSDVEEEAWYEPYVATAASEGIVSGYEDGSFRPEQCVTRAEGVKMAMVAFADELPYTSYEAYSYYDDVTEEDWHYDYLAQGFQYGVVPTSHVTWVDGEADYTFGPNESMDREEVAALFYRLQTVVDNQLEIYNWWEAPYPRTELFTKSCTIDRSDVVKGMPLEQGMIADADGILRIDGENRGQLRQFALHVDEIGGGEVWSNVIDAYNWSVMEDISYENFGEQIIMDDWQLGMSVRGSDIAFAARTDQFNEFQHVLGTEVWQNYGADVVCEAYESYTTWTVEWADLYVLRYGDLFVVANSDVLRGEILDQIELGDGYNEIKEDALLYGWLDLENSSTFFEEMLFQDVTPILELGVDEVEFRMEALSDGFEFTTTMEVDESSELFALYEDADLEMVDKVPAGDLLFYMEDQDLSLALEEMASYFLYEENAYEWLEAEMGYEAETLQILAESGYAMTVSDSEQLIPDMAFYLHLTHRDEKALAAELTAELDAVMAEAASETYYTMDDEITIDYLTKGEGLNDEMSMWTLNSEEIAQSSGTDYVEGENYEFHYGLVEEDIYVIALHHDFAGAWGGTPVDENRRFTKATDTVEHTASKVTFVDLSGLGEMLEMYVDAFEEDDYTVRDINMVSAWLDRMGWLYSATYVNHKNQLEQVTFWSI